MNWKRTPPARLVSSLGWVAVVSVLLGVGVPLVLADVVDWKVILTLVLAFWILLSHGADLVKRIRKGSVPLAYAGMLLAHVGFALALVGVAITSQFSIERDLRMAPGESADVNGVSFRFVGISRITGPNYLADQAEFVVIESGQRMTLRPEKRTYLARRNMMTEAAIDPGLTRDIYLSLGEPLEGGAWAVRIQVKPFVRWIWLGGLLMALGGCVAVLDARYRRLKKRNQSQRQRQDQPDKAGAAATG